KKALGILMDYRYPGNVRELRNILEYAVNVCQEGQILPQHLPAYLTEITTWINQTDATAERPASPELSSPNGFKSLDTEQTWTAVERKMIMDALVKSGGRRSKTADLLGWGRSTLWRKMKQYGIG
ncbi:MAG: sigma-54-dependent Fis family transcriptional regulator, partial [Proteobacteria bacterium]|nr:sigma-54-dependent Fis family transcriptional regulator [Pseudomonadota bacterium]